MPKVAIYTMTVTDHDTNEQVERVHVLNPWHKTSAPGIFPETWNLSLPDRMNGEPEDSYLRRIADEHVPPGTTYTLIDLTTLPNRRFRNAWKHNGTGRVDHDLPTVRTIRKRELMAEKAQRLVLVREKRDKADETGKDSKVHKDRLKALHSLDDTLDSQLATLSDVAILDTWKPDELKVSDA